MVTFMNKNFEVVGEFSELESIPEGSYYLVRLEEGNLQYLSIVEKEFWIYLIETYQRVYGESFDFSICLDSNKKRQLQFNIYELQFFCIRCDAAAEVLESKLPLTHREDLFNEDFTKK